jgi:16S rRNA (guanine966-N2)-methyltransferase
MSLRIYGNRLIETLPGEVLRPTSSKVREAIFNIWQGSIEGCRWLDLCAGSGSMGAEALCRGAKTVVGIEREPEACAVATANLKRLTKPEHKVLMIRGHVLKKMPTLLAQCGGQPFDRIYFDPPYTSELYEPVLEAIVEYGLLSECGEVAAEHLMGKTFDIPGLDICREKKYGKTGVTFFQRSPGYVPTLAETAQSGTSDSPSAKTFSQRPKPVR